MTKHRAIMLLTMAALIMLAALGALAAEPVEAQEAVPSVVTPLPTNTPMPAPTCATTTLGYDQALTTYKEIATEVIKSADRVLDITKWIVASIFSLVGVAGGAILLISRSAGQAKDSAARSAQAAENSKAEGEKLEDRVQDTLAQIQATHAGLQSVSKQAESLQRDLGSVMPRLMALADVDSYALRLYSTEDRVASAAVRALVELSRDDDPVVRRKSVCALGAMADHPQCFSDLRTPLIVTRLQKMALEDPEHAIRLEAQLALSRLGADWAEET